jgi:hypothetical protein
MSNEFGGIKGGPGNDVIKGGPGNEKFVNGDDPMMIGQ